MSDEKVVYVLNSGQNGGINIYDPNSVSSTTELPNKYLQHNLAFQNELAFSDTSVKPSIKVVGVHNENQSLSETTSVNCFEIRKEPDYTVCGVSASRPFRQGYIFSAPIINNPVNANHTLNTSITTNGNGTGLEVAILTQGLVTSVIVTNGGDGYKIGDTITITNPTWSSTNPTESFTWTIESNALINLPELDETQYDETLVPGNTTHLLNRVYPRNTDKTSYLLNKEHTSNYRIKCYDSGENTGQIFKPLDFDTYDYFVVINPDIVIDTENNHTSIQTHFAKIKEITSFDTQGDSFEFTPRYSSDISKNTKFEIWKGPRKDDTSVVALSYGLRGNSVSSDTTLDNFITDKYDVFNTVSRPTFYFYNERLKEENQLDFNTKYLLSSSRWWKEYTASGRTFQSSNSSATLQSATFNTVGTWTYTPIIGQSIFVKDVNDNYKWVGNIQNINPSNIVVHSASATWDSLNSPNELIIYIGSSHYHTVFKTKAEHDNLILDNSKLSIHGSLIDNHKINDETATPIESLHPNLGGFNGSNTYDFDARYWRSAFRNKRRSKLDRNTYQHQVYMYKNILGSSNFNASEPLHTGLIFNPKYLSALNGYFTGENIYAYYKLSPEKVNKLSNTSSMELKESNNELTSLLTLEVIDAEGIQHTKIKDNGKLRLRQELQKRDGSFIDLGVLVNSVASNSTTLNISNISNDLSILLQSGDTILVGNYYYIIDTISSLSSNSTQDITISAYRHQDSMKFTLGTSVQVKHENQLLESYPYVRNKILGITAIDNTFDYTLNLPTINGQFILKEDTSISKSNLLLRDNNYSGLRIDLEYGDKTYNYVVPKNITPNLYYYNPVNILDYYGRTITLEKTIFNGVVEDKNYETDNGIRRLRINGRNNFNRLQGIELNKKLTFSEDFVHSSISPYVKTTYTPSNSFDSEELTFTVASYVDNQPAGSNYTVVIDYTIGKNSFDNNLIVLDSNKNFLGLANHVSVDFNANQQTLRFTQKPINTPAGTIYVVPLSNCFLLSGKSIETDIQNSKRPTHLESVSNKGIVFDSGEKLNTSGNRFTDLMGTSANNNVKAKGYHINSPRGIIDGEDSEFAMLIGNERFTTADLETIQISNATQKLPIVNMQNTDDNKTTITLAAVSPLVMGRIETNTNDTIYPNASGLYLINSQGMFDGGIIHRLNSKTGQVPYTNLDSNNRSEIYRYIGLEKGDSGLLNRKQIETFDGQNINFHTESIDTYSDKSNSGVSAYARVYLTNASFTTNTPIYEKNNDAMTGKYLDDGFANGNTYFYPKNIPHLISSRTYNGEIGNVDGSIVMDSPIKQLKERWELNDPSCYSYDLFSTGSIQPHSYNNVFNLLKQGRDLSKYSLILTNDGVRDKSLTKTSHGLYDGLSERKRKLDKDYESLKIVDTTHSSNIDRFSLIRLVEDTYDWHFNPFNPLNTVKFGENLIQSPGTGTRFNYGYICWSNKASSYTSGLSINSGQTLSNSCDTIHSGHGLEEGDIIYKTDGTYVGIIQSGTFHNSVTFGTNPPASNNHLRLKSGAKVNVESSDSIRIIQEIDPNAERIHVFEIYGSNRNKGIADGSIDRNFKYNFTRSLNINAKVNKDYYEENCINDNKTLIGPLIHNSSTTPVNRLDGWHNVTSTTATDFYFQPSKILHHLSYRDESAVLGFPSHGNQNVFRRTTAVYMNIKPPFSESEKHIPYSISGMSNTVKDDGNFHGNYWGTSDGNNKSSARISLIQGFGEALNTRYSEILDNYAASLASNYGSVDLWAISQGWFYITGVSGVQRLGDTGTSVSGDLIFKPQINVPDSGITCSDNSNTIEIDTTNDSSLQWINYTPNLEGKFLVGNKGVDEYDYTSVKTLPSNTNPLHSDILTDGIIPNYIGKIISHTHSSGTHTLTLDKQWGILADDIGVKFRLMRIEPKTIPKDTKYCPLYVMNNRQVLRYTGDDEVLTTYAPRNLGLIDSALARDCEGIFELYVIASSEQTIAYQEEGYLIMRDLNALSHLNNIFLNGQNTSLYITDGVNSEVNEMALIKTSFPRISFKNEVKNDYYGAVSIGEMITITTELSPKMKKATHGCITAEMTICSEVERTIEELLEENGISFETGNLSKEKTNFLVESYFYSSNPYASYIIVNNSDSEVESILKNGDTLFYNNIRLGRIHSIQSYATTKCKINIYHMINKPSINSVISKRTNYPYFVSGNIAGDDLLAGINYLATYKDIESSVVGDVINFSPKEEMPTSKANISYKNEDVFIEASESTKSLFKFANKIIVYGDNIKVVAEMKVEGKRTKTLNYYNDNIKTKTDAKVKAEELLDLHSKGRQKIKIKLHKTGIEHLNAGDVITLNFPQQEIPKDDYMIFEIKNTFADAMELSVVAYEKSIAERFAELAITEKKNATKLFSNQNIASETLHRSYADFKINPISLRIRHTVIQGNNGLGFNQIFSFTNLFGNQTIEGTDTTIDLSE